MLNIIMNKHFMGKTGTRENKLIHPYSIDWYAEITFLLESAVNMMKGMRTMNWKDNRNGIHQQLNSQPKHQWICIHSYIIVHSNILLLLLYREFNYQTIIRRHFSRKRLSKRHSTEFQLKTTHHILCFEILWM